MLVILPKVLSKGRALPVGTRKRRGPYWMKKVSSGKWVYDGMYKGPVAAKKPAPTAPTPDIQKPPIQPKDTPLKGTVKEKRAQLYEGLSEEAKKVCDTTGILPGATMVQQYLEANLDKLKDQARRGVFDLERSYGNEDHDARCRDVKGGIFDLMMENLPEELKKVNHDILDMQKELDGLPEAAFEARMQAYVTKVAEREYLQTLIDEAKRTAPLMDFLYSGDSLRTTAEAFLASVASSPSMFVDKMVNDALSEFFQKLPKSEVEKLFKKAAKAYNAQTGSNIAADVMIEKDRVIRFAVMEILFSGRISKSADFKTQASFANKKTGSLYYSSTMAHVGAIRDALKSHIEATSAMTAVKEVVAARVFGKKGNPFKIKLEAYRSGGGIDYSDEKRFDAGLEKMDKKKVSKAATILAEHWKRDKRKVYNDTIANTLSKLQSRLRSMPDVVTTATIGKEIESQVIANMSKKGGVSSDIISNSMGKVHYDESVEAKGMWRNGLKSFSTAAGWRGRPFVSNIFESMTIYDMREATRAKAPNQYQQQLVLPNLVRGVVRELAPVYSHGYGSMSLEPMRKLVSGGDLYIQKYAKYKSARSIARVPDSRLSWLGAGLLVNSIKVAAAQALSHQLKNDTYEHEWEWYDKGKFASDPTLSSRWDVNQERGKILSEVSSKYTSGVTDKKGKRDVPLPKVVLQTVPSSELAKVKKQFTSTWDKVNHASFSGTIKGVYKVGFTDYESDFNRAKKVFSQKRSSKNMQLYHGTDFAAAMSIIKSGFQVPRSVKAGRMLGDGVYLADTSSKSCQYLHTKFTRHNSRGVLFLCETETGQLGSASRAILKDDTVYMGRGQGLVNTEYCVKDPKAVIPRYWIDVEVT